MMDNSIPSIQNLTILSNQKQGLQNKAYVALR